MPEDKEIKEQIPLSNLSSEKAEIENNNIIVGSWKLVQINEPWEISPLNEEDEIWGFNSNNTLEIKLGDSILKSSKYELKHTISIFTHDSTWIIISNFHDSRINDNLEISINENELKLLDRCDDCYSFEFERLNT